MVAAVNPCPCGYFGHPRRDCRCSEALRLRYQARLSGPLLDRLDMHVAVPPVDVTALTSSTRGESSAAVRSRVAAARGRQRERFERGAGQRAAEQPALGERARARRRCSTARASACSRRR